MSEPANNISRLVEWWVRLPIFARVPASAFVIPILMVAIFPSIHVLPPLIAVALCGLVDAGALGWMGW